MKIFYAVQATGNGHISRASEILPYLQNYGEVDIFLSGSNYGLKTDLPVAYRSKGISLFYDHSTGSIDVAKTIRSIAPRKLLSEARHLPLDQYDIIINDFEPLTSLSCKLKGIECIHFGHQASFKSKKVPRPTRRSAIGEWVLKNYAYGTRNIGLHFDSYDKGIYSPIIKRAILESESVDKGHITVYLGQYADDVLIKQFHSIKGFQFHLFSSTASQPVTSDNVKIFPVNKEMFSQSMLESHGVITGGGFETPAEALLLKKKLMVIPMKGQYEQQCNAAALQKMGVMSIAEMDDYFPVHFNKWMHTNTLIDFKIHQNTEQIIHELFIPSTEAKNENVNFDLKRLTENQQLMVLKDHLSEGWNANAMS